MLHVSSLQHVNWSRHSMAVQPYWISCLKVIIAKTGLHGQTLGPILEKNV